MAEFADKQAQIDRLRREVVERYPQLWAQMIAGWKSSQAGGAAWLMYSANYLVRTGGVRWAMDPFSLGWRIPAAPKMDLKRDLEGLDFILLTHAHKDHLDLGLIAALKDLPVTWVVPDFLAPVVQDQAGIKPGRMIVPRTLEPVRLFGLTIVPFESRHLVANPDGTFRGLPEVGYLVEWAGGRLLFPGDVRIFEPDNFPQFGGVDVLFAHLWLGRGMALKNRPEMDRAFCRFCAGLHPGRVVITHLHEFGRDANDFLDEDHLARVGNVFERSYPHLKVECAYMGDKVKI